MNTSIRLTGIQILEVTEDTLMSALSAALYEAGLKSNTATWAESEIVGRPIFKGEMGPDLVHKHLHSYFLISNPCRVEDRLMHKSFFGFNGEKFQDDVVPKGTLILVEPLQSKKENVT